MEDQTTFGIAERGEEDVLKGREGSSGHFHPDAGFVFDQEDCS